MVRKVILALAATGIVLMASACNTVQGLGEDISSAGKASEDAINK